jgi:UDP-N-acetylmuramate: L-alanyl-gamma-D-glutamyl-meso-diaminopimelate ligase
MPDKPIKSLYLMGIGGIAMGTLATMLKEKGFQVAGSDQNLYPPMSTHLKALGIPLCQGYTPANLDRVHPDLVIIGNVIRRDNPEADYVLENGIPYLSMVDAIDRFFLCHHDSLVIAGTHGKSTTSALLAWVLESAGLDPSALIGGFVKNWQRSYRLGRGRYMVLEGDEYDTAFFDKTPKFLHYRPQIGVITSVEFDHADIYADFDAVFKAFQGFVEIIPEEGELVFCADDAHCRRVSAGCRGQVWSYGESADADYRLLDVQFMPGELHFRYRDPQGIIRAMRSRLPGRHNLLNTLAVVVVASRIGIAPELIQKALLNFQGVKRRQDVLGESNGIVIIDDFAHHPTAVRETLEAISRFYPGRRLWALFEPRSNSSRRRIFQQAYSEAFDRADVIAIKEPPDPGKVPADERLDIKRLVADIRSRGGDAYSFAAADSMLDLVQEHWLPGDVILAMSNGDFDGVPECLWAALKTKDQAGLASPASPGY